ncbi:unnamed protein product [Owenia fusiformis]|uniref:Transmembrane protein 18 n=1 Tax=Owenia fusiformis TaxID=6347 RepID=A0A8J1XSB0_OWEFU|nr:unnamed protein product [Owenia fusiformis]
MTQPIRIDEIQGILSYLKSINWSEPWLCGLVAFHLIMLFLILVTRRHSNTQMILFFSLLSIAFFSEHINQWASSNWKLFSKEQYFDSNGMFISILFSAPILVNCLIIVAFSLWDMSHLLISVGRAKAKHDSKQQTEQEKAADKKDK